MSRVVTNSYSTSTLHPTGYTGSSGFSTNTQYTNTYSSGYNGTSNDYTYANMYPSYNNTSCYIYFTFTIPTIPTNATNISITASARSRFSNGSGITGSLQLYSGTTAKGTATSVSGTTSTVYNLSPGNNWTVSEVSNLRLRVNATRTSSNRTIRLYGADVTISYSVQETEYEIICSVDQDATLSSTDEFIPGGNSFTLTIAPNDDLTAPVSVTDNNIDVTNSIVQQTWPASSYTVTTAPGASYGFTQSGSSYVSNNTGRNSSAAVSLITLTIRNQATVTINAVASSEANYDYGYLSEIGSTFSTSVSSESSYKWRGAGTTSGTVDYGTLSPGIYVIYAKYYKDSGTSSNNDTFTFTVNISETIPTGFCYTYTLSNVQADHTIVVTYASGPSYNIYVKQNGSWIKGVLYVKDGGTWKEAQAIYTKDSTWKQ